MICPTLDQLTVDEPASSTQPRSAPESRRSSMLEDYGEEDNKDLAVDIPASLASRTASLPNCSDTQSTLQTSPTLKPSAKAYLRGSKSPKQEARQAFKDRSSSSPCPPSPPPPTSTSVSPRSRRHLSLLRHHTSLDSAALACDFFGHQNSLAPSPNHKDGRERARPALSRAFSSLQEEESMTSSPLLRRPIVMSTSCLQNPQSIMPHLQTQPASGGGGGGGGSGGPQSGTLPHIRRPVLTAMSSLNGKAGPVPSPSTPYLRRRLTITLPSSLPVSPVAVRTQKNASQCRTPSMESCSSGEPPSPSSYFRVVVLGDVGVGKTALIHQMTMFKGAVYGEEGSGRVVEEGEGVSQRVVISMDRNEEHCALEIFDNPLDANIDHLRPDAFIVIYSVSDRKSYLTAKEVTRHLRCELGMDRPVFLVGNKMDLRRQQRVAKKEAKDVADAYDCCVVETSAALRINVDSLLLQVVDRIMEQLAPPGLSEGLRSAGHRWSHDKERATSPGRAMRFFSKILRRAFLRRSVSSEAICINLNR